MPHLASPDYFLESLRRNLSNFVVHPPSAVIEGNWTLEILYRGELHDAIPRLILSVLCPSQHSLGDEAAQELGCSRVVAAERSK
jgi:hypothetical protein